MESHDTLVQGRSSPAAPGRHGRRPRISAGAPVLVLDRYRLLERLGEGGFGIVWRARDELLQRDVAVKRIRLGPAGDRERAAREAHASARLAHPAIVALYEACVVEDAFYLISELVEGQTLSRLIAADGLEDKEVIAIGIALCHALEHAHARGVIHRDIKPQNVLVPDRVDEAGAIAKLTDFGGAILAGEDALTRSGDVLGTLAYMAPEQIEGRSLEPSADLYSLALVLYEALSGVNPVRGPTPGATARRIGQPLPALERARPDLPRELSRGLDIALDPEPASRGEVSELAADLEHALAGGVSSSTRRRRHGPRGRFEPVEKARRASSPQELATAGLDGVRSPRAAAVPLPAAELDELEQAPTWHPPERPAEPRLALPRSLWIGLAVALLGWQAWRGHAGVALLLAAALAPLLALPGARRSGHQGAAWLACGLAPLLGYLGLAGAFPAIAGQAASWRLRALLGALAYWWLVLAEPLLDGGAAGTGHRLWLAPPPGTPLPNAWEGSMGATASHVIGPLLTLPVLCGALLWGAAAIVLPWIVRGRAVAIDVVAVTVWSAGVAAAATMLDSPASGPAGHPEPRGLVLGAVLGGMIALAARALRGPV